MKSMFTLFRISILIFFFPLYAGSQQPADYHLLLNSGKFIPEENISRPAAVNEVLNSSLFQNTHYVVLQFYALPDQARISNMKQSGIRLSDYLPNLSYTAQISRNLSTETLKQFNIRSILRLTDFQKTVPALLNGSYPDHAVKLPGYVDLIITTYEKLESFRIKPVMDALNAVILQEIPVFRNFKIRVPFSNAAQLVNLNFIQWAEFIDPPDQLENLPGRTLHRVSVLQDGLRNLKGDGVNIGVWDGGNLGPHVDFLPAGRVTQVQFSSASQHATHVSGTLVGRGLINHTARGMAPNAKLYVYDFNGDVQVEMSTAIPNLNLAVSSHSYGGSATCGLDGSSVVYSSRARSTDINLNNFPYHLHAHSSGNSQTSCAGGWSTITGSGKPAKNNILVANISSFENISGSSSFGPVQDGRIKPEISAMGTSVFSTSTPEDAYATLSGTSMAAPGIAGSLALMVQRYKQLNSNNLPISALIKNILMNTAHDLGNTGPDYQYGFGRINALEAVKILEDNRYVVNSIATGGVFNHQINVPAGAARIRVMLTWNDPAATANANPALVNNLDLTVINGATTSLPFILDPLNPGTPATTGVDNVNNVEQVLINNPVAGSYTLRVTGTSVPTGPNQEFALTWIVEMPYIEVIYPNGGENFNPGSSEIITWNNAGVTGLQTIEYSTDGGNNWNVLTAAVPSNTTRFTWSIPGVNSSTVKVRISSGSISDISDDNFNILGTVTGFAGAPPGGCSNGEAAFSWTAVTNATHYDLYRLDVTSGEFAVHASNITGTSYIATGLPPGENTWFTIRAKNNTTNAVSQRANAIKVLTSNGGGLGTIGPISGSNQICGTPTTSNYSVGAVTGATNYNWTVPSGASVSGGQGTTSITVNFSAGSSSGNITVTATNGTCNTTPSVLAVTIGSTSVAPPTSGGNQSQTVCAPDPLPTLTATASVPPGHTLVWYNAATGGQVVASPTWNTAGSITYYAASRDNSNSCESSTRTPVTLTINSVPQASATANGPTTFCDGGSVTLTANSGNSYSWSNGATSQSINVASSGTYSVTVSNSGCVSTSQSITVTVNPRPDPSITAGGPTTFCEGNSVQLTASSGGTWIWSTGATTQSISVTSPGNYSVTLTNSFGCSRTSAAVGVTVTPKPVVSLSASPYTSLLPGLTTTLTANVSPAGSYTYAWFQNGNPVSGANGSTLNVAVDKLGTYTVTATSTAGCFNTSSGLQIRDSASKKLFIMPNPNRGQFEVSYHAPSPDTYTLSIYDSKGALAFRKSYPISSAYQRMPVDMRVNGKAIYQIVLTDRTGKKLVTGKVVTQ